MSFGPMELIIILVIVLLLFGTTKLKSIGSDLGSAIKGFRSAVKEDEGTQPEQKTEQVEQSTTVQDTAAPGAEKKTAESS